MGYASSVAVINLTRTADTNAYAAGDVVGSATSSGGGILTITNAGPVAGNGQVLFTTTRLAVNLSAVPSGMTSFRLHLYSSSPGSAYADNAAWDLPSGDRSAYLGYIDLGTPVDVGSTLFVQQTGQNVQVTEPAGTLYGYLVTNGAYTPSSGDVFKISLNWIEV